MIVKISNTTQLSYTVYTNFTTMWGENNKMRLTAEFVQVAGRAEGLAYSLLSGLS